MRRVRAEHLDDTMAALIVTYGSSDRKRRPLDQEVVVLGSGRGCDLTLSAPDIAPVHCILYQRPAGWSVRDCGSRAGTHLNGEPIREALLSDGDLLQVGSFCFRACLPAAARLPEAGLVPERTIQHLRHSRRNLARLALAVRSQLRDERQRHEADLDLMAHRVRERLQEYEERTNRLGRAERDLLVDREIMSHEFKALHERMLQAERDLAARQAQAEAELRERWQRLGALCQQAGSSPLPTPMAGEVRRLELRRKELAHYAHHLHRAQLRLRQQEAGARPPLDSGPVTEGL